MKLMDVLSIIRIDRILIRVVKAVFGGKKGADDDSSEASEPKKSKK